MPGYENRPGQTAVQGKNRSKPFLTSGKDFRILLLYHSECIWEIFLQDTYKLGPAAPAG